MISWVMTWRTSFEKKVKEGHGRSFPDPVPSLFPFFWTLDLRLLTLIRYLLLWLRLDNNMFLPKFYLSEMYMYRSLNGLQLELHEGMNHWRRAIRTGKAVVSGAAVVSGLAHMPMFWHTSVGFRLSFTRPLMISGRLFSMMESQIFSRVGSKESREQSCTWESVYYDREQRAELYMTVSILW